MQRSAPLPRLVYHARDDPVSESTFSRELKPPRPRSKRPLPLTPGQKQTSKVQAHKMEQPIPTHDRPAHSAEVPPKKKTKTTCYLLDLPYEIRVQILKHLLQNEGRATIFPLRRTLGPVLNPWFQSASCSLSPQIISTCKQLRQESEQLLYNNTVIGPCYDAITNPGETMERYSEPTTSPRRYCSHGSQFIATS